MDTSYQTKPKFDDYTNFKFIPAFKKDFYEIIKQMKEAKEIEKIIQKHLK